MGKCLLKISLLIYGFVAVAFFICSPVLAELLYSYGPDFVRQGHHLKIGVIVSWILAAIIAAISGGIAMGVSSDIKCN